MDPTFRNFFDRLHQIMGLDTTTARQEALVKLERAIAVHSAQCLFIAIEREKHTQYEEFIKGKPSPQQVAEFVRGVLPAEEINRCTYEGAQSAVKEYISSILKLVSEEQRKQVDKALTEFLQRTDPSLLKKILEGELSTTRD